MNESMRRDIDIAISILQQLKKDNVNRKKNILYFIFPSKLPNNLYIPINIFDDNLKPHEHQYIYNDKDHE